MVDAAMLAGAPPGSRVGALSGGGVPDAALPGDTCRAVATRLVLHKLERLPVVASPTHPQLRGIVSRSDLIEATAGVHAEEHDGRVLSEEIRRCAATRQQRTGHNHVR